MYEVSQIGKTTCSIEFIGLYVRAPLGPLWILCDVLIGPLAYYNKSDGGNNNIGFVTAK